MRARFGVLKTDKGNPLPLSLLLVSQVPSRLLSLKGPDSRHSISFHYNKRKYTRVAKNSFFMNGGGNYCQLVLSSLYS